jgi:hypothetical protein
MIAYKFTANTAAMSGPRVSDAASEYFLQHIRVVDLLLSARGTPCSFLHLPKASWPTTTLHRSGHDSIPYFIFTAVHTEVCPSFIFSYGMAAAERMNLLLAGQSRGSGCARGSKHGTRYRQAACAGRVGPSGRE